jgi:hypothetical protein
VSRTAAFGEHLDSLGIWWPRGDGDAMRLAATAWNDMAELLEDVAAILRSVGATITENYRGEAAERFHETWQRYIRSDGYVATTIADCRRLATALKDFGGDIDEADATLLGLVEEALAMRELAAAAFADPRTYDDWLRECAAVLAGDLGERAGVRSSGLAAIAAMGDAGVPVDVSKIDADSIDWADIGDPRDLSYLADETIDFGAGQGTVNAPSDEVPVPEPEPAGGGGGGGAAGFGGGGGGGFGAGDFSIPEPEPIEIAPPPKGLHDELALGGAGAAAAVAAANMAKSGRMPFFPMMPIGGAAGGDDGTEPRRRKRKLPLT